MQIVQRFLVGESKQKPVTRAPLIRHFRIALTACMAMATGNALGLVESSVPEGLSAADWNAIQAVHDQEQYRPVRAQGNGWIVNNPRHGFKAHFATDGSTTLESTDLARPFTVSMRLSTVGYGEPMELEESPEQISEYDAGVRLAWTESLREWWINSPDGLEQWFELSEPPADESSDQPLRLGFSLDTTLEPSIEDNALVLASIELDLNIRYARLKVWDATGRILPAQMALDDGGLSLTVDDDKAIYPVTIDPTFEQIAYIKASNTDAGDRFGSSVAVSGDIVVVGAPDEESSATGVDGDQGNSDLFGVGAAGAAYVFVRDDAGSWSQQAYLKASNTGARHLFGNAVSISGNTVVVGASRENGISTGVNGDQSATECCQAGAAYVFVRDGAGNWLQQAYLKASNTDTNDFFGSSVSISNETVVIGAPGEDSNTTGVDGDQGNNDANRAGAAYVFVRDGSGVWTQQAYLKASNTDAGDDFGHSVSISADTVIVGARFERSNANGVNGDQDNNSAANAGAAYVFGRDGAGNWMQEAYLKASNSDGVAPFEGDLFGRSVAISGDTVVVGAPGEDSNSTGVNGDDDNNAATDAGAAYIFVRDSGGSWTQQSYIKASNTDAGDSFGNAVAISVDTVVVTASFEAGDGSGENNNSIPGSGAVYIFARDDDSGWSQENYLKVSNPDVEDAFGASVSISNSLIAVGSDSESSSAIGIDLDQQDNRAEDSGAAYIFSSDIDDFPSATIDPSNQSFTVIGDEPGDSAGLGLSGATDVDADGRSEILIGAPFDGDNAVGSVYLVAGTERQVFSPIPLFSFSDLNGLKLGPLDDQAGSRFGRSVLGGFDFDGDGLKDIAIGHPRLELGVSENSFSGAVQWVSGTDLEVASPIQNAPPVDRFLLLGRTSERVGQRLAFGDFNGDGFDDMAVQGFDDQTATGSVFLVFGNSDGAADLITNDLPSPAGIAFRGEPVSGLSVNGGIALVDVNNDGCDDLAMGGERPADPGIRESVFVVYGQAAGCAPVLADGVGPSGSFALFPFDGTSGIVIERLAQNTRFGNAISGIGDFNGDGLNDFAIGEPQGNVESRGLFVSTQRRTGPGAVHVIHGWEAIDQIVLEIESLPADRGTSIFGWMPNSLFGVSVAGGGDLTGDGIDDLVVGASRDLFFSEFPEATGPIGRVYLVPGSPSQGSQVALSDLLALNIAESFTLASIGMTEFGWRVVAAGDFGGDGISDLIVSAPDTPIGEVSSNDTRAGQVWVVSGGEIRQAQLEILGFTVTPASLERGGAVTIEWNAAPENRLSCEADGLPGTAWVGPVTPEGSIEIDTSGLVPGQYQVTLTCTLDGTSVSETETRDLEVLLPPTELNINAAGIETGIPGAQFVTLRVSNDGQQNASDVVLSALSPENYELVAGYRLAPSCAISPPGSGEVRCNVNVIADWECIVSGDLTCDVAELPVGGSASVVVELQGSGSSDFTVSVSAGNAAEVSTQFEINN